MSAKSLSKLVTRRPMQHTRRLHRSNRPFLLCVNKIEILQYLGAPDNALYCLLTLNGASFYHISHGLVKQRYADPLGWARPVSVPPRIPRNFFPFSSPCSHLDSLHVLQTANSKRATNQIDFIVGGALCLLLHASSPQESGEPEASCPVCVGLLTFCFRNYSKMLLMERRGFLNSSRLHQMVTKCLHNIFVLIRCHPFHGR